LEAQEVIVSLSLSLSLLAAPSAASEPRPHLDAALSEAQATDVQRDEVHQAVDAATPAARQLRDEALDLRDRFRALALAEDIDVAAVEDVRLDAVDWFDRATALAARTWVAAAEALDPDQRATLQARRQARVERIRAALGRSDPAIR
jgi:Spy/CpxP family protein refolding chaperone